MEHIRVVAHFEYSFHWRDFQINNELNNGIMPSFLEPSGVSLSHFDGKALPTLYNQVN